MLQLAKLLHEGRWRKRGLKQAPPIATIIVLSSPAAINFGRRNHPTHWCSLIVRSTLPSVTWPFARQIRGADFAKLARLDTLIDAYLKHASVSLVYRTRCGLPFTRTLFDAGRLLLVRWSERWKKRMESEILLRVERNLRPARFEFSRVRYLSPAINKKEKR